MSTPLPPAVPPPPNGGVDGSVEGRPRRSGWTLLVPAVLVLGGLLFAASATVSRGHGLRGGERSDLPDVIAAQQRDVRDQAQQVRALRDRVAELSRRTASRDGGVARVLGAARATAEAAQVEGTTGPSLSVALDDAHPDGTTTLPDDIRPDDLVVHQQDVQAVVNALWAGGAEAMQLMDQRVISTSAVRCVGNLLLLQGRTYPPPYRITAVGDVAGMRAALDRSEAVRAYRYYVDRVGLGWTEHAAAHTTLPAFAGPLELQHASVPAP